jgi:hypothetical protein
MIASTMPLPMVHQKAESRFTQHRAGLADAVAGRDVGIDDVSADPAET